jgi:hypothetical protein
MCLNFVKARYGFGGRCLTSNISIGCGDSFGGEKWTAQGLHILGNKNGKNSH